MTNRLNQNQYGNETQSIVLVGVGGQGILLASEIIARTVMASGFDVKMNEIHGMAQRGGSVVAQIRLGREVASPLVPRGTAKVLGSLERIEAMRFVDFLAPDGLAVVSDQAIIPVTASVGSTPYPDVDESLLRSVFPNLIYVHALYQAEKIGNAKAVNTVLLGALSTQFPFSPETWKNSIKTTVKPRFVDVNLKAFDIGRNLR